MRHFSLFELDSRSSRFKKNKSDLEKLAFKLWYKIASLVLELEFETDKIQEITESVNSDVQTARALFQYFRLSELYILHDDHFNNLAKHIAKHIDLAITRQSWQNYLKFITDLEMQSKMLRCNRSSEQTYKTNKEYLFANVIHNYNSISETHLISLIIQRDIFICFFKNIVLLNTQITRDTQNDKFSDNNEIEKISSSIFSSRDSDSRRKDENEEQNSKNQSFINDQKREDENEKQNSKN